jgi:hypothetical protein
LQCLGNIVIVYSFTYFVYGKKVIAIFAQIPLFVVDDATFDDVVVLAFGAGYDFHIYKFCINIIN